MLHLKMNFGKVKKLQLTLLFIFSSWFAIGQGLDIGLGIGGANYDGDLIPANKLKIIAQTHPAISAFFRFELNPWVAASGNVTYTSISADDAKSGVDWMIHRNLSFKTNIFELSGMVEFHPLGQKALSPFVTGGAGIFYFNPRTRYNGDWVELRPLGTEGQGLSQYPDRQIYKPYALAWMAGGGLRYRVNDQMWISADLIGRVSTTDYLDDVSKTYVDYYELLDGNGPLAAALGNRMNEGLGISEPNNSNVGINRGSASSKDFYFIGLFKFHYRIYTIGEGGRKIKGSKSGRAHWRKCPTF